MNDITTFSSIFPFTHPSPGIKGWEKILLIIQNIFRLHKNISHIKQTCSKIVYIIEDRHLHSPFPRSVGRTHNLLPPIECGRDGGMYVIMQIWLCYTRRDCNIPSRWRETFFPLLALKKQAAKLQVSLWMGPLGKECRVVSDQQSGRNWGHHNQLNGTNKMSEDQTLD